MGVRVTVSEYLAAAPRRMSHAFAPIVAEPEADVCVAVTFEGDRIEHQVKYRPHYRGPLPKWPNLIGRNALSAYAEALPVATQAVAHEVRTAGHKACLFGVVLGTALAGATSEPSRTAFWCIICAACCLSYLGARRYQSLQQVSDIMRLEALLALSCIAVRAYLGEFGERSPVHVGDTRLDAASRACFASFVHNEEPVCQQAWAQYVAWASRYRYRRPPVLPLQSMGRLSPIPEALPSATGL